MSKKEQYPNGGPNNDSLSDKDAKATAEAAEMKDLLAGGGFFPDYTIHLATVPSNDPWAHRSEGMKCKTCMWFAVKATPLAVTHVNGEPVKGQLGRCRRRAPTMNGFPAVFETDWCGDHKLDEGKI